MDDCARARPRSEIPQITVRFLADGQESIGTLQNVSRAGVCIRSAEVPRPGVLVALGFDSPHGSFVDLRGEVRWNTRGLTGRTPEGFGVRLHEPPREFREFFLWVLEQRGQDAEAESVEL